ncbi:MAG: tRNA lysidine(34) synthetase TilS [Selenomonadaceae bacterium]|nr:tRNA lysidine(34) synthetase TilS [Selenomonadaceae bacterium]
MLLKKFIELCKTEQVFPPRKIVVAVSGGADSLALADLLHRSQRLFKLELCIAHFEHGLRGQASLDDAAFVKSFAENLGVEFYCESGDVQNFAAAEKISVELAARQLRYEFLSRVRLQKNFDAIALAHHADDQAETILMRLLRGSGVTGISAMQFCANSPHGLLIRPLLRFRKCELENYCRARNITPRIDATNFDAIATRNKIRLELLPALEEFNPAITETLCRFAEISAAESDFISAETEKIYSTVVARNVFPPGIMFDVPRDAIVREEFLKLPLAIQRAVIRRFIAEQTGSIKDFGFANIEAVRKVLLNNLAGTQLPNHFKARQISGILSIEKDFWYRKEWSL